MVSLHNTTTNMTRAKVFLYLFYAMMLGLVLIHLSWIVSSISGYELGHLSTKYFQDKDYSQIGQNASKLNPKIRLLCWVMTSPKTQDRKRVVVKNTWGKRCDKLIFMSNEEDSDVGAVNLNVPEGGNRLWGKVRTSLKYLYDHYIDEYDWFFRADDDSYIIVENLRYVLTPYDTEFPIALGGRYHFGSATKYLGGGCGYVLSRAALKRFMEVAYNNSKLCRPTFNTHGDDVQLGKCLVNAGVMLGDSRDQFGKRRFFQHDLDSYINGKIMRMYPMPIVYEVGKGIDSLSETTISFHKLNDESQLYTFEFLIYKLKIFGFSSHREFNGPFPAPLPPDVNSIPEQVLEKFGHPNLDKRNTVHRQ